MTNTANADYAAFILRISLGIMFIAHGLLKVIVFTVPGTVQFFDGLGLPPILAYFTIFGEIFGGLLLLAGILTRYVALALIPVLAGALFLAHWSAGWMFANQGGGWEYPAFLIAASVAVALLGDGAFALGRKVLPESIARLA